MDRCCIHIDFHFAAETVTILRFNHKLEIVLPLEKTLNFSNPTRTFAEEGQTGRPNEGMIRRIYVLVGGTELVMKVMRER